MRMFQQFVFTHAGVQTRTAGLLITNPILALSNDIKEDQISHLTIEIYSFSI